MSDLDDDEIRATRKINGADRDIRVGEYVRMKDGFIKEINNSNVKEIYNFYLKNGDIIAKYSSNIIDLIEKDDYVNGLRVERITDTSILTSGLTDEIFFKDIRTIVTHEQFDAVEYKVEK